MNVISIYYSNMEYTIQFIMRWDFTLKFIVAVVSMEIRDCIYPLVEFQRRYGCMITRMKLSKTCSKGFVPAVEEWDSAWFRKECE